VVRWLCYRHLYWNVNCAFCCIISCSGSTCKYPETLDHPVIGYGFACTISDTIFQAPQLVCLRNQVQASPLAEATRCVPSTIIQLLQPLTVLFDFQSRTSSTAHFSPSPGKRRQEKLIDFHTSLVPTVADLTGQVMSNQIRPAATGGFGDIYHAQWRPGHCGKVVEVCIVPKCLTLRFRVLLQVSVKVPRSIGGVEGMQTMTRVACYHTFARPAWF
jgi:hypothetical protein